MKVYKYVTLIIAAVVLTVGVANAQVQQKISEQQLTDLLSRIDTSTGNFVKAADKAMDKAGYDGSPREDELNQILKRFKSATAALAKDHSVAANAKSNFETVLHHGVAIENFFKKYPLDGVETEWTTLRSDLGELAAGFNITWEQGHAIGAPVGAVDVKSVAQHIEDVADKFKEALDKALDASKWNNTKQEDEVNQYVREFRDATNNFQDHYNEGDRAAADAKEVLTKANKIDGWMKKYPLTPEVQSAWVPVRTDLDRLAKYYNVDWQWK
jgi:hypothetical protein